MFDILKFPNEIITLIISAASKDGKTALRMLSTCKRIRALSTASIDNHICRSIRQSAGWPDPMEIQMSDYTFMNIMNCRGCIMCSRHPRIRTVHWEFGGKRLCNECYREATIRCYQLSLRGISREWFEHLPSIHNSTFGYHTYWKDDIPTSCPTAQDKCKMIKRTNDLIYFKWEVKGHQSKMYWQKKLGLERARKQRVTELKAIIAEIAPSMQQIIPFEEFECVRVACKSATTLTSRMKTNFIRRFWTEYDSMNTGRP